MEDFLPVYIFTSLGILYICIRCMCKPRRVMLDPNTQEELQSKIRAAMNVKED